jgi:hypothetical protein
MTELEQDEHARKWSGTHKKLLKELNGDKE